MAELPEGRGGDMGSMIVFATGFAAMVGSGWLIWRLRETERPAPLVLAVPSAVGSRVAAVVQRSSGMLAAAAVAGLLVPGMGGRLMMRLLAATSPESAQGRLTDADEVVGEVTFGGTVFLVLFIGLFGGLVSLGIFVLLRRWLPQRSITAGLVIAALGGGLFARPTGFVNPDNRDFSILSPTWLAVVCALVIIGVYGVLFAVLVDSWASHWPRINRSKVGVLAAVPFVVMLGIGLLGLVPGLVMLAVVAFAIFIKPRIDESKLSKADSIGRMLTGALALAATAWLLVSVVQVLRI